MKRLISVLSTILVCISYVSIGQISNENQKITAKELRDYSAEFGYSIDISGDYCVIGAPKKTVGTTSNQGMVFVYNQDETGHWDLIEEIVLNYSCWWCQFGASVAINEHGLIAIGSPRKSKVYIYTPNNDEWIFNQELSLEQLTNPRFGEALSMTNDGLCVGAPKKVLQGVLWFGTYTYSFAESGYALFYPIKDGLTLMAENPYEIRPNTPQNKAYFGSSIELVGNRVIVGAPKVDINGLVDVGMAYEFEWSLGAFIEIAEWVPVETSNYLNFGIDVALTKNNSFVGSLGNCFIYENSNGDLVQTINNPHPDWIWPGLNYTQSSNFGGKIDASNDYLIVASKNYSSTYEDEGFSLLNSGTVDVYWQKDINSWLHLETLFASDADEQDVFGSSVVISDQNKIIVGAPGEDHDELGGSFMNQSGSSYYFDHLEEGVDFYSSEEKVSVIKLFPNPVNDVVNIYLDKVYPSVLLEIYNLNGKLVLEQSYTNVQMITEPFDAPEGSYVAQLTIGNKERKSLLFIND